MLSTIELNITIFHDSTTQNINDGKYNIKIANAF